MQTKNKNSQSNNINHEKRKFPRVYKNVAIKLKDAQVDFVTETINLSCIGAYCQVDGYISALTKLKITILLPRSEKKAKHIVCEGTVVRVERTNNSLEPNTFNIAIYFNHISKSDMHFIDNYVKTALTASQQTP